MDIYEELKGIEKELTSRIKSYSRYLDDPLTMGKSIGYRESLYQIEELLDNIDIVKGIERRIKDRY